MRRSFRTRVSFFGWIPRVYTLGWYSMPLQGMESETWMRHEIGIGMSSFHLPQQGNAYKPRASPSLLHISHWSRSCQTNDKSGRRLRPCDIVCTPGGLADLPPRSIQPPSLPTSLIISPKVGALAGKGLPRLMTDQADCHSLGAKNSAPSLSG